MRSIRLFVPAATVAALVALGARGIGPVPPLGPLVDPVRGAWALARSAEFSATDMAAIPGLRDSVIVVYDDRAVPHIFASSYEDVIRALGFVVARDRLMQLELQTRATEGTLSALFGAQFLGLDRTQRELGLAWSADRAWARMDSTGAERELARAFADGVNAWIDRVDWRTLPLEYRLLNARPTRWKPVHAAYLARRMGYTLTYSRSEFRRREVNRLVGRAATEALFGPHSTIQEPIQPGPRPEYPWFDRTPLPPPEGSVQPADRESIESLPRAAVPPVQLGGWLAGGEPRRERGLGSNNWAVAPARSATGHALLAGDPHLDLSLPSIWYEVHLVVPGSIDVYGVTIPGIPGVVIGFNRDVAWTFTNTGADVLDYYEEVLDDDDQPSRYRVDGQWRDLGVRVEIHRDPSGRGIAVDTLYFTHRGPLLREGERPLSLRWTNLDAITEVSSFREMAASRSVAEFLAASESWGPSAQNMLTADRSGAIAIRSTGLFPIRPSRTGADVLDGTTSADDWAGYWPIERYPMGFRPAQGYLASANQEPVDPLDDSTYLGVEWPSPWRALRINRLLRADSSVTAEAMRRYQLDPGNERAELFVPLFLSAASVGGNPAHGEDEAGLERASTLLAQWDRHYSPADTIAVLFEAAMDDLEDLVWDELIPPTGDGRPGSGGRVATPATQVLWRVVQDSTGGWCDVRYTPRRETCQWLLARSLATGYRRTVERLGAPSSATWRWDENQQIDIWHLLRIPSLSALDIGVQGGPGTLNPASGSGTHGASWRMVVELGEEVRAWVTYPGGQSGNPASQWYDDRLPTWVSGGLDSVLVPRSPQAFEERRVISRLSIYPRGPGS